MLQSVYLDIGFDHAELNDDILSADVEYLTHAVLSFDFHNASLFNRLDFRFSRFWGRGSSCLRFVLFILLAFLLFEQLLHLSGNLVLVVLLFYFVYLSLEVAQFLAGQFGAFLFCLSFLDGTDGVFNAGVRFLQQVFCIFLGLFQDGFTVLFQFLNFSFILGNDIFHLLFTLADVLALGFPIALVANDVLQILVGIYVFATHDFGCIGYDFFRQTDLASYFYGK